MSLKAGTEHDKSIPETIADVKIREERAMIIRGESHDNSTYSSMYFV